MLSYATYSSQRNRESIDSYDDIIKLCASATTCLCVVVMGILHNMLTAFTLGFLFSVFPSHHTVSVEDRQHHNIHATSHRTSSMYVSG